MKTVVLPDDLSISAPISVHIYESNHELNKQQVRLNQNTFSFLQAGYKEVFFDDSSSIIDSSKFLLMKSGHCLMTEKLTDTSKKYKSILLFFSNELILKLIRKYQLKSKLKTQSRSTYSFNYSSFSSIFVDSLVNISKLSRTSQENLLPLKFEELMLYLIEQNGSDFLTSLIRNKDNQTQNFIHTIEQNKLNKLSIKELAFISNMSVSTFKRTFEKHFQTSPSKWFQQQRIEHAAYLLKNESKRPTDIYEEAGYESLSTFTQAFKLKYGLTPKQFQSL